MSDDKRKPCANERYIPAGLPGGFFIYNAKGDEELYFADDNVIKIFGCTDMEDFRKYVHNSFMGMVYPEDLEKVENAIQGQTMFGDRGHDFVRYRIKSKTGEIRYMEDFGHLVHGANGSSYFYVFILDIGQEEFLKYEDTGFAAEQIFAMSKECDLLTGLYNMSYFYKEVQKLLYDRESRLRGMTFIHFDIKNFKVYNERYGFQKGDELLCEVSAEIRNAFPEHLAARLSNDHFIVCTYEKTIVPIIMNIHDKLQKDAKIEIKAGIYYLEDTCDEVGFACDYARMACNGIKHHYDVCYALYDNALGKKLRLRHYIVEHLDEAIEHEYIKIFYQPVIRVSTGEICGYEALARWKDPAMGMLSPLDFIETLEEYHLIHKLDCFVARKVCEDFVKLREMGEDVVPVSINLSRLDFQLCNIYETIDAYRRAYDVPQNMLDIEITEGALNDTSGSLKKDIDRFRENGYSIWIDDFGSGYSSLNVISQYDFDVLKLDMKFLRSMDRNPNTGTLLYYIVYVAQEMGFQTVTEGVETIEHYEFLKKIGSNKAQGYFFSKPLPLEEVRALAVSKGLSYEKQ